MYVQQKETYRYIYQASGYQRNKTRGKVSPGHEVKRYKLLSIKQIRTKIYCIAQGIIATTLLQILRVYTLQNTKSLCSTYEKYIINQLCLNV